ncbi:MAG: hypothetical protein J5719_06195, partial [Bacteroidales bacterium]|nr:hypothetical protein [Bacteroidales bacterium]
MDYTINDLMKGTKIIANSVFGNKKEFELKFNHEEDGCWYIDFPGWPFDHHNLMMVAGADDLCSALSDNDLNVKVKAIPTQKEKDLESEGYIKLTQIESGLTTGSTYTVTGLEGFNRNIWLCPVTLFV